MAIDGDPRRSASHLNLLAHLTGPFREAATSAAVPIVEATGGAIATIDAAKRMPLILVGTRQPIGLRGIRVTVAVQPRGAPLGATSATLRFAPFTERGAFLPVWHSELEVAPAIDCKITLDGAAAGVKASDAVELHVVEGMLGRLLYAIGAEKARVRRQARELAAVRRLTGPLDADTNPDHRRLASALDRLGADLGVPRLADRLTWDAARQQVASVTQSEPNEAYRTRLAMMRRFVLPTRGRVEAAARAAIGGAPLAINEANAELAVAIQLVASPDARRTQFLARVRATYLVQPGRPIPPDRLLPSGVRAEQQRVLDRIGGVGGDVSKATYDVPAGTSIAPLLAEALDRIGRCRAALGVTRRWKILRGQDDAGGSRYELGLGVDVEAMPAAELDQLAHQLTANTIAAGTDVETVALLASLQPQPSTVDPVGRWLLTPAGLRTVQPIAGGRIYLSHFPSFGMTLAATGGSPIGLEARFHAPGDPGPNAALWFARTDIARDAAAAGIACSELAAPAATAAIAAASLPTAAALAAFTAAGLRTPDSDGALAQAKADLAAFPPELITTYALDPALSAGVLASTPQAVGQLTRLVAILGAREIVSALPLVSGTSVLLVVSVGPLPGSAARLNSPRQGVRWYVLPVEGLAGTLELAVGPRNHYTAPTGATLAAVVAVSIARRDRPDPRDCIPPYQVRVQMPPGQLLDLAGYERLMNLLERTVPIGVVIDTEPVREAHVAPAGDGHPVAFVGRMAHTFRAFKQRRHLGSLIRESSPERT